MPKERSTRKVLGRIVPCLALVVVFLLMTGCFKAILAIGYLVGGPPSVEPDFETQTKESLTDKDVVVAVVCYATKDIQFAQPNIDKNIAKFVTHRLNQHKIKVVNPDAVSAWLDKNPEWDSPAEIGEALGVTHVVYIDLQEFSLNAAESTYLYRGKTDALVTVTKMEKDGSGEPIYSKDINEKFPLGGPRSTYETTPYKFKAEYLSFLSEQIGWLFYERFNGDRMRYFQ